MQRRSGKLRALELNEFPISFGAANERSVLACQRWEILITDRIGTKMRSRMKYKTET